MAPTIEHHGAYQRTITNVNVGLTQKVTLDLYDVKTYFYSKFWVNIWNDDAEKSWKLRFSKGNI